MASPKFPAKIRYEYQQDSGTRLRYAHGIWGGINPHGEIEMNFYSESDKLPEWSERVIAQDGSVGNEMPSADAESKTITRHVHSKILINYETARAIYDWLDEQLATLEMEDETNMPFTPEGSNQGGLEQ